MSNQIENSIIIIGYNSSIYLKDCFESLIPELKDDSELIFLDNASTDSTDIIIEKYKSRFTNFIFLKNTFNTGFANACNQGAKVANGYNLIFLNPDVIVSKNWLSELVKPLTNHSIGAVCSKVLNKNFYSYGGHLNYLGYGWADRALILNSDPREVSFVPGTSFAMKKSTFDRIGGFEEDFFMYSEDGELSMRLILAGYSLVCNPKSEIFHYYRFIRSPRVYRFAEAHRKLSLIKNYRFLTLIKMAPPLFAVECGLILFSIKHKFFTHLLMSHFDVIKNLPKFIKKRKLSKKIRKINDKLFLRKLSTQIYFPGNERSWLFIYANKFLKKYYSLFLIY